MARLSHRTTSTYILTSCMGEPSRITSSIRRLQLRAEHASCRNFLLTMLCSLFDSVKHTGGISNYRLRMLYRHSWRMNVGAG